MFPNAQKQAFPILAALDPFLQLEIANAVRARAISGSSDLLHNQTSPFKMSVLADKEARFVAWRLEEAVPDFSASGNQWESLMKKYKPPIFSMIGSAPINHLLLGVESGACEQ